MSPAPIGTRGVLARDQARVKKILSRHPEKPLSEDTLLPGRITDPGLYLLIVIIVGNINLCAVSGIVWLVPGKLGDSSASYMFLIDAGACSSFCDTMRTWFIVDWREWQIVCEVWCISHYKLIVSYLDGSMAVKGIFQAPQAEKLLYVPKYFYPCWSH